MARLHQVGQRRTVGRLVSLATWGSFGLGGFLLTGCSHTPPVTNAAPPPDPLFGVVPPPPLPNGTPGATPTPNAQKPTPSQPQAYQPGMVPPIPTSLASTNNASLAATSGLTPFGRLAMDDSAAPSRPVAPGQLTSDTRPQPFPTTPSYIPPNANPKVQQVPDVTSSGQPITPTGSWEAPPSPPSAVLTVNGAQSNADMLSRRLQERGVVSQKQDPVPEGIRLTCYVSRGPAGGFRIYEVTAADYPTAAQAILQQIESAGQ